MTDEMKTRLAEAGPRMEVMANAIGALMAAEFARIDTRKNDQFGDALTDASSTVLSVLTEAMAKAIITTSIISRKPTKEMTNVVMLMVQRAVAKLEDHDLVRDGREVVDMLAGGKTVTIEMPDLSGGD